MALLSLLRQFPYDQDPTLSNTLLLSLFCFITVLFVFKFPARSKSRLNLPPSPPKLPIIGNLHQLTTLPHRSFAALSQKYGPLMILQLGQTPTLVVSSAEMAMEIMKTHDLTFADRPQTTGPRMLLYGCTDVGFGPYGENWRQKKKICVFQLLSMKRVQSFQYIREEEAKYMVNKLREVSLNGASSVNLSEMLIATSNNIVCKCVLGQKYNTDGDSRIGELARKVMIQLTCFSVGDFFPSLGWIDVLTGLIRKLKATFEALDEFFDQVIEEHKRVKQDDDHISNSKDLVDILLQLQGGMLDYDTHNDIKSILMDMFVGGTDTTSTLLEWVMAELVRNPMKMKKAQEEIRRVVGHKSKVDEYDINQMSYLKWVVKETLRIHPPSTLVPPRVARSSVKLSDYTIPAKTMVYINAWAIQRDPEFWERPEEFLPERFENKDIDFKGQDFHLIPFGSGRRACPGTAFGIAAVESVLANLLYWFDWKLPRTGTSVQDIDMSEVFGLTVSKKMPLYLQPIPYSSG